MGKIRLAKKFWLIFLILIILFLFVFFSWLSQNEIPEEIKIKGLSQEEIKKPVSSVYLYDFKEKEYLSDKGESWQNSNFIRYIYDLAPGDSNLDKCYYFLYDNLTKRTTAGGQRKCNDNLTVTVGENRDCSSQGEKACTLYVFAKDSLGNEGEMTTVTYHIDWKSPKVGKAYQKEKNYLAEVSDNLKVGYCWLYLDNENVGSMEIENSLAILEYPAQKEESYTVFVRCADHYVPEKENYLNLAFGELAEFVIAQNHPPEVSYCRVIPTQGTVKTDFRFEVVAVDPDDDTLSYKWDFGEGEFSNEENPTHYYSSSGTYQPKVTVLDSKGEEVNCSTAWVVISSNNE